MLQFGSKHVCIEDVHIFKHCREMTLFLLWIGTYCISCVVQQTSGVKDLSSLVKYDDSCLAAIRHVQSNIPVVRPRPNIRSHSTFYTYNTAHVEHRWPLWYNDRIASYQHCLSSGTGFGRKKLECHLALWALNKFFACQRPLLVCQSVNDFTAGSSETAALTLHPIGKWASKCACPSRKFTFSLTTEQYLFWTLIKTGCHISLEREMWAFIGGGGYPAFFAEVGLPFPACLRLLVLT